LPGFRRVGGEVRFGDVVIHHTGYRDRVLRPKTLQRDSAWSSWYWPSDPRIPLRFSTSARSSRSRAGTRKRWKVGVPPTRSGLMVYCPLPEGGGEGRVRGPAHPSRGKTGRFISRPLFTNRRSVS